MKLAVFLACALAAAYLLLLMGAPLAAIAAGICGAGYLTFRGRSQSA